jgi:PAS domain S-box-containing protein
MTKKNKVQTQLKSAHSRLWDTWKELSESEQKLTHIREEVFDKENLLREVQEELAETENKMDTALRTIVDGIVMVDSQGEIVYMNNAAEKILNIDKSVILDNNFVLENIKYIDEKDRPFPPEKLPFSIVMEQKKEAVGIEHGMIFPDNSRKWISVNAVPLLDSQNNFIGAVASFRDITQRKMTEKILKENEEKFRMLAENTSDMVCMHDPDGTYRYVTPSCKELLGYEPGEMIGRDPYDFIHPEDRSRVQNESHALALQGQTVSSFVYRIRTKSGEYIWFETHTQPVLDSDGNLKRLVTSSRNVTQNLNYQRELKEINRNLKSKNEELEQILYVTSHDMRSPLVNVQGFSKELSHSIQELQAMVDYLEADEKIKENFNYYLKKDIPESLDFILNSIMKMDSLINALLHLSRIGRIPLNIEVVDMNEFIKKVMKNFEFKIHENNIKVELENMPSIESDSALLSQVFSNLIDNAIKYSDPEKESFIRIWGEKKDHENLYFVEDNGLGIAPDQIDKIFQIFYRSNPQASSGEGIGLASVKKVLDKLNGEINVGSEKGEGSIFRITLPRNAR